MDPFEACDDSLVDAFSVMAEWQENAHVTEEGGAVFVTGQSRFPTPFSNAMFPIDAQADPERALTRAETIFSDRRYILWARGATGGPFGASALRRGFSSLDDLPAMAIEDPVSREAPPEIDVQRVTDRTGFADFLLISQLAYAEAGLPEKVGASLLARAETAIATSVIAVGRVDGTAVSAAVSITNGVTGVGGLYWVGTTPAARRRGAAEAVTRFVTNAAFEQGACIVVLQASEAGAPLYARMGYREVGRYARFLSPKST